MQAKFQGLLFTVEKMDDLPAYFLSRHGKHVGTVYLDNCKFYISVSDLKKEVTGESLSFSFEPYEFQILNYDVVTSDWLCKMMKDKKLTAEDVAEYAGTSAATVYRWRTEVIPNQSKAILFSLFNK